MASKHRKYLNINECKQEILESRKSLRLPRGNDSFEMSIRHDFVFSYLFTLSIFFGCKEKYFTISFIIIKFYCALTANFNSASDMHSFFF